MYLSCLLINTGENPDSPRPGRLWLRNVYHVHQRLCMAFPSRDRRENDPDFLAPYAPEDFPAQRHVADKLKSEVGASLLKHVHEPRNPETGFLFRIDPQPGGSALLLAQSGKMPDWGYAFHNAQHLLAALPEVREYHPHFENGQRCAFRLLANPTRRLSAHSLGADGGPIKNWANKRGEGMRVPVPEPQFADWLARRGRAAGFTIEEDSVTIQPGYVYFNKNRAENGQRLRSVRYDGVLEVEDHTRFLDAITHGIGSGKAFGFSLLSVRRV